MTNKGSVFVKLHLLTFNLGNDLDLQGHCILFWYGWKSPGSSNAKVIAKVNGFLPQTVTWTDRAKTYQLTSY